MLKKLGLVPIEVRFLPAGRMFGLYLNDGRLDVSELKLVG